jgi:Uma2 family endonuclease
MIVPAPQATRAICPHCQGQEQRLVLHEIEWHDYVSMVNHLMGQRKLRITFDCGTLELMTTSNEHEFYKTVLGRFFETLAEEHKLLIAAAGNMTFQREDVDRGFESDECYWIANEPLRRGRITWDPASDPPPDLVVEIEISRSCLDKMGIYASFGVPELWCFSGERLRIYILQADRTYLQVERSPSFPAMPPEGIVAFAQPNPAMDHLSVIRSFRAWVREQLAK